MIPTQMDWIENMNPETVLDKFEKVRTWSNRNQRAPHKPLLIIWAIGQCLKNEPRLAPFKVVDAELTRLLIRFGPHGRQHGTYYPFWRLQNDDVWEIDRPHLVNVTSSGNPHRLDLVRHSIQGGLRREYYERFQNYPNLALGVISLLLDDHFAPTLHPDILEAAGIVDALNVVESHGTFEKYSLVKQRQDQSAFRRSVLKAYKEHCSVCAYSVRVEDNIVAVEAAHIRWYAARGPSEINNSLALCSLHHKLFDYGAFTIMPNLRIFVSGAADGSGFNESLGQFHEQELKKVPSRFEWYPEPAYLAWHQNEVFRSPQELPSL